MKIETKIKIELDVNEGAMDGVKREISRYLRKIEDLYDMLGVFDIKVIPLGFDKKKLEWKTKDLSFL